ncbi:MAG: phosphoribosylglycinamide formyltransferase [Candidatus Omnitrophota bacterium]|nr:phosphoribosylglycinamide formyltransferase [Candidatus Omnitrophota bacterium]
MNIAIFASGRGTNFSAIAAAIKKGRIKVSLSLLVCDNPKAGVLLKAKSAKVEVFLVDRKSFSGKIDFENSIIEALKKHKIKLVVLAGFMRILSARFVRKYNGRIINIHPSLLPAFKGEEGIKDAFSYGVKVTGVTVHFVDVLMDHGPIILQQAVSIDERDTQKTLEEKIHRVEHTLYPRAIKLFCEGKLKVKGRKVSSGKQGFIR